MKGRRRTRVAPRIGRLVAASGVAVIAIVEASAGAVLAQDDEFDVRARQCVDDSADPDLRIGACNWLLQSGRLAVESTDEVLAARGRAFVRKGQHREAVHSFGEAIRMSPQTAGYYDSRAVAYSRLGEHEAAIADYRALRQLRPPKVTWDVLGLVIALREAGHPADAMRELEFARSLDEDGPGTGPGMAYHFHLGKTLHALGRYRDAVVAYTAGIPKQPDFYWVRFPRALAYEAMGDLAAARADLLFVLDSFRAEQRAAGEAEGSLPGNPELIEALRRLDVSID